jgi:hypothetical protein
MAKAYSRAAFWVSITLGLSIDQSPTDGRHSTPGGRDCVDGLLLPQYVCRMHPHDIILNSPFQAEHGS